MIKRFFQILGIAVAAVMIMAGCGNDSGEKAASAEKDSQQKETSGNAAKSEDGSSDYPSKKIEVIIPQGVGTGSDLIARVLTSVMEKDLGVPFVCTNVEGGSTSIGLQQMADSEADGYTIAMNMTNLATLKALGYSELSREDVEAICSVNFDGASLFIKKGEERFTNLPELVEYAKAHPGELSWGTGQAGGMWHMAILKFCSVAGIEVNVVPNAGGGVGLGLTLANGDIDVAVSCPVDCIAQLDSGDIEFIASLTAERQESYPDVPTARESGWDCEVYSTRGFVAPKGTPSDVIAVLEKAFRNAVDSEEYKEYVTSQNTNMIWRGADEYTAWLKEEVDTYVLILEEAGLAK